MKPSKKILILHTGGTLGMNLSGSPEDNEHFTASLKKHASRIFELGDMRLEILMNKDSSNMTPRDWIALARKLNDEMANWDGFVITHGTDTLAFTAAALSFMLMGVNKPIILTGSQRPLSDPNSDAPRNLINAVEFAVSGKVNEVAIFFDSVLLRGNRAKKVSVPSFGAFDSPNFSPLARVGVRTEFSPPQHSVPSMPYRFDPRLETRVMSLPLFPGIDTEFFYPLVDKGLKGLILQAFGPGDIPLGSRSAVHLIRGLTEKGIPVAICSQAIFGAVDLNLYETGRAARDAGAISACDMTWEAALVKMMVLLGRGLPLATFDKEFTRNLSGEMSPVQ